MSWRGQNSIELGCNSSGSERRVILWKRDGYKTHECVDAFYALAEIEGVWK